MHRWPRTDELPTNQNQVDQFRLLLNVLSGGIQFITEERLKTDVAGRPAFALGAWGDLRRECALTASLIEGESYWSQSLEEGIRWMKRCTDKLVKYQPGPPTETELHFLTAFQGFVSKDLKPAPLDLGSIVTSVDINAADEVKKQLGILARQITIFVKRWDLAAEGVGDKLDGVCRGIQGFCDSQDESERIRNLKFAVFYFDCFYSRHKLLAGDNSASALQLLARVCKSHKVDLKAYMGHDPEREVDLGRLKRNLDIATFTRQAHTESFTQAMKVPRTDITERYMARNLERNLDEENYNAALKAYLEKLQEGQTPSINILPGNSGTADSIPVDPLQSRDGSLPVWLPATGQAKK